MWFVLLKRTFLHRTITYSMTSCMHCVEGKCEEINTQCLYLVNASWHGVCRCAQDTTLRTYTSNPQVSTVPWLVQSENERSGGISNGD